MTAHLLGGLCKEAGFPPGVLNILQGLGPRAGGPLCAHRDVRAISFTGSTRVGGEIARESATSFKKVSLEMGGKNPTLIFADADLREAVPQAVRAAFSNSGQICLCGSRILIEKSVYDRVRDELVERVRALRVGDPLDPATEQGALVSRQHFEKVMGCLSLAREEGARDAVRAEFDLKRDLGAEFVEHWKLFTVSTLAASKEEYLRRPDLGRRLDEIARSQLAERCPSNADLQIVIGDGLSVTAVSTKCASGNLTCRSCSSTAGDAPNRIAQTPLALDATRIDPSEQRLTAYWISTLCLTVDFIAVPQPWMMGAILGTGAGRRIPILALPRPLKPGWR